MLNQKVDQFKRQANLFTLFDKFTIVSVVFILIIFIHECNEHDGNGQIEHEHGADDDAHQEVEHNGSISEDVLIDI